MLSHSVGTGDPLPDAVVRLVLATKAVSLARGHSGVRPELVDALLALANADVLPVIPAKGSVGASGDLAPLSHLACVLIGEGQAKIDGQVVSGTEAMRHVGLEPFVLGPKEGLALLNGTQVSTALALVGLFQGESVFAAGLVAGCLTLEAIKGSVKPFDARIHEARGQLGQIAVAAAVRELLDGSAIDTSHPHCGRVQDPYSIRCVPQVMGACLDNLSHAARVLVIEANAASGQPAGLRQRRRDLGRQLPRRARGLRGRHHRPGSGRDRRHLRAPHGPAAGHRPVGPAGLPDCRQRRELGLHDRPGHGRRPGCREPVPGPPQQRH